MTLTVEDGTGLANADALVALVDVDAYHTARGNSTWTGDDADKETAIRRASFFLTNSYSWQGFKVNNRDQALAWPRTGVVDQEGYAIPITEVPQEIKDACAELALRELTTPGTMTPDVTLADKVNREKVGEIEVEYANSRMDAYASRPVVTIVNDLIAQFLATGSQAGSVAGSTVRA